MVVRPTPDLLRERLARLTARVEADRAAGRQARLFFYYSGHARATALDLGPAPMPLAELRQRLFAVPATLTVVVLDACQSGAFSDSAGRGRVKGAAPAADFSFNSRQQLDASGVAVLASSSGSELSQESEQLRSSYFTHHLLVGLRGAGDANRDGTVSVDEAYRYAYHQTLLATAATAVGGQHVSLEVDLKGHGEVPLSFPRAATAAIELPAALEGHALVHDPRAKAVVAETHKARGAATRIAVAPGEYEVIVRHDGRLRRCGVRATAGAATIALERCSNEAIVVAARKGGGWDRPMKIEVIGAVGPERADGFVQTLRDFSYGEQDFGITRGLGVAVTRRLERRLWVGGAASYALSPEWTRSTDLAPLTFQWSTSTVMAVARGVQLAADDGLLSHVGVYGQLGAGLAIGRTRFVDLHGMAERELHFGPALSAGAGLHLASTWLTGLSAAFGYELVYAPAIANRIGDTHASGGHRLTLGLSYSY